MRHEQPSDSSEQAKAEGRRILLLAEDAGERASVCRVLERLGHDVFQAANQAEAEQLLRAVNMDGVLACVATSEAIAPIKTLRASHPIVPVAVMCRQTGPSSQTDIIPRVRIALEKLFPPLQILVVEDEFSGGSVVPELLDTTEHDVVRARTVREAFSSIAKRLPDVVITDLVLSDGSGLELIVELRKKQTCVIAMADGPRAETYLSVARRLGAAVTLQKPVGMRELLSAITNCSESQVR